MKLINDDDSPINLLDLDYIELEHGVYVTVDGGDSWTSLHFFREYKKTSDGFIKVKSILKMEGPSGPLRKARHTYIPNNGYIFYVDYNEIMTCLNYAKNYFDLD